MGRQVTVSLVPLLKAGCTLSMHKGHDETWLRVVMPDGGHFNSDAQDCLSFDCRSIEHSTNAWVEKWLIANGVPYAHG